ncbi:MAG: MlaE family lipid ABC transporter permease subunit [Myxococcota bacterium]
MVAAPADTNPPAPKRPTAQLVHAHDGATIALLGELDRNTVPAVHDALLAAVNARGGLALEVDLAAITRIDSAGAAMLGAVARDAAAASVTFKIVALSAAARTALAGFRFEPAAKKGPLLPSLLGRVGDRASASWRGLVALAVLTADTVFLTFAGAPQTRRVRRGATWSEALKVGVDALPIVGLIAFLIGIVVALQSAAQLRQFGASIYVADLITVAMTREMGPLMTAIIIAGRSGAAIAAEIATMTVSQEVDALRTMGLQPVRYIVVPKFTAMTLTMPCLVLLASAIGIVGGFLVAVVYLDLGAASYWHEVISSLRPSDLLMGTAKALTFGWIIVLLAAHRGFQARGGAESVGRVTTASVVSSVFWVIVADAAFSLVFNFDG